MNSRIPRRIRFDPEDLLPNNLLTSNDELADAYQIKPAFKKIDPKKWVEAKEFVPRSQRPSNDSTKRNSFYNNNPEFDRFLHELNSPTNEEMNGQLDYYCSFNAPQEFMPAETQTLSHPFVPACFPFPSTLIPQGYSANFTTLNGDFGSPIATIVLKKKRKRRHRRHRVSIGAQTDFNQTTTENKPSTKSLNETIRPLSVNSEPELEKLEMDQSVDVCLMSNNKSELNGNSAISGSCPELNKEQLRIWDEILFKAVQNEREALDHKTEFITKNRRRTTNSVVPEPMSSSITSGKRARSNTPLMQTSIYEICAMEQTEGEEEEEDCCDFNGNLANSSMCQENCQSPLTSSSKENDSSDSAPENKDTMTDTQKLAQKLRKEMEDLQFRTSYGWQRSDGKVVNINTNPLFDAVNAYPQQDDFQPTHMANYNPKMGAFASTSLHNGHQIQPEECQFEADYFENMNIRVNPFEESNDIILDELNCPQPTRFQQLQWAIQRQKERYNEQLQMPQRVCCSIM